MITGELRITIDKLWTDFWTGGISNPVTVIEQITFLLFIRMIDEKETSLEIQIKRGNKKIKPIFGEEKKHLRWSHFKNLPANQMLDTVRDEVFPFIKTLSGQVSIVSEFSNMMKDANFEIKKPGVLQVAVETISKLDLKNTDTAGDLYEYLLYKMGTSGVNGQFRTPRHITRMMVEIMDPDAFTRICDPACGTSGFLISAGQFILEKYSSDTGFTTDVDGNKHFMGDKLKTEEREFYKTEAFTGYEFDGSMLRIASMNLWLHGIENPRIFYSDTLSKDFVEKDNYDLILANPPFKGQLDIKDVNEDLTKIVETKKTELLFLALFLRLLDIGGRAAAIVPDGVLFGSSNAHIGLRTRLVEQNQLEGVISMPSGVFKPYAGVSTAILIFTKGGKTDKVWFYDMENDGLSLDDKSISSPLKA
ncbi:MAG: SAM-dependent DNA methyltransferase [Leptospiraceae bacterium]|nr:SAM-dependent DNA methyltransferase [Leptospiraceae bacterium]